MVAEKPGYKWTYIGWVPEDWEVKTLGHLGVFSKGSGIRKEQAHSGHLPCVRYGELYTKHHDIIRCFYSFISEAVARHSKPLTYGDILFACSGETKEDIGKCAAFLHQGVAYAGGDVIIWSPHWDDPAFLAYLLNSDQVASQKSRLSQGEAVVHIRAAALAAIQIPLPPRDEQKAIAAVLMEVDGLIESLEQLMAKKRAVKAAAMQQLLTGSRRLPGFEGAWEACKLSQVVAHITTGKLNANAMTPKGAYRFYTCAQEVYRIDTYAFDDEALLVSGNGHVGYVHYCKGKFNAYQRTYVLTGFDIEVCFLKYYMRQNLRAHMRAALNTSPMPYMTLRALTDLVIKIPVDREEQAAIASVLSDMDTEIKSLEQRLDKVRSLKIGMMQALLTGSVRLRFATAQL